ncbi:MULTISPECIES: glycosyltransferase family 2 protein [unclassified Sulfitobacter]|jgi:GT2 family glycosyltransferase|uniref:glycosyltransferase family 2 protein n=1 Tax=unclassified Sulfitobacter TaxID=196795 RepID=UPI0007C315B7|nr:MULTISPECIES: glycosyltransferase family A protein [unclassified Sulfitobacter]KZX97136.1 glycosyl transferase [Sulfitobacter sp. HI0021]KZY04044.1 glycosyl transferase [Sulfitobacter sp. HI0027]KZZ01953.1 glycosyl transferase [Sulfitobacter sp. HI0076]
MSIGAVVIGRNEGARLERSLQALAGQVAQIVYVDSGSTDGSVAAARGLGAEVVELDMKHPFTAARARNAGVAALGEEITLVQFLDGDCILRDGWLAAAEAHLSAHPQLAVVCGRRREEHPQTSIYNSLVDAEWDTPPGEARACGGDALMRLEALRAVGGYRAEMIAGEEPELCQRLRRAGWQIWRLDAEMTWHDAQITRFSQWWRRSLRAGHAFAEGAALHGAGPDRHWVAETRRAVLWGALLPAVILLLALLTPWAAVGLMLLYPLQLLRLIWRGGAAWGFFTLLGKFPEALGVLKYHMRRDGRIIEYR